MERTKTTSDPRLKRELATRAFKLARAAEALGGEAEVKSPWYLSHGDARGDSIMQVFETKEAAIDAPEISAGTYDPLLLSNISHLQIWTRRRVLPWPRMPQALDPGRSASILGAQCSCSLVESRDRACVSEPPPRWKRTGLYPLPTS